jgi:SAM-dependent methyltransferase
MGLRSWIYDRALLPITTSWYREVLERVPRHSRLLDIGIGTGGALANNADLIKERDLRVVGIDIDPDYVVRARARLAEVGLQDHVRVELVSVYDFAETGFDAAYFSASFMLLPDSAAALRHVLGLLTQEGRVYFTQTFQDRRSPVLERVKPVLKTLTTIDFGNVTYEPDFLATLDRGGVDVLEHKTLTAQRTRSYRLVVAHARAAA